MLHRIMLESVGIDGDDILEECAWCGEPCEESDLIETQLGPICTYCYQEIQSRGEPIVLESLSKKSLKEAYDNSPEFKAYITNLGKYNEGDLIGDWVSFPIDEDEFSRVLESIGIDDEYEEWFVTDYECSLRSFDWEELGEYPTFETLQEFGMMISEITDVEAVDNAYEFTGNLQEAIEGIADGNIIFLRDIKTDSDLGHYYADEYELPLSDIEEFFDFEQLGRELSFDSYGEDYEMNAGEYFCGDEDASDTEIGETYVADVGIENVANPEYYFDYEEYGRRLALESDSMFTKDGYVERF